MKVTRSIFWLKFKIDYEENYPTMPEVKWHKFTVVKDGREKIALARINAVYQGLALQLG